MPAITPRDNRRDWRRGSGTTNILSLIKVPSNGTNAMKSNFSPSTTSAEVILANAELAASAGHKVQYRKTKVCPWNGSGRCVLGDRCNYAHSPEELRTRPDLSRTKLCPKGTECPNKSICSFAHDVSELRATGVFYRTKICKFWKEGRCPAGEFCRHAHGEDQLRAPLVLPSVQEQNHDQEREASSQKTSLIQKDCERPENHSDVNRQKAHPFLLRALSTPLYYPFEYNQYESSLTHPTSIDNDPCPSLELQNADSQRLSSPTDVEFLRRCDSLQIDTSFLCSVPLRKTDAALETDTVQQLPSFSEKPHESEGKTVIPRPHIKLLSNSTSTASTTTDCSFTDKLLRDDENTSSQETIVQYTEKFPMRKANTLQSTADILQETTMTDFTAVKDALENLFFTVNQPEDTTVDQEGHFSGATTALGCPPFLTKRADHKLARQSSSAGTLSFDYGLQSHSTSPRISQKDFFLPLDTAPSRGNQCLLSRTSSLSTEDPGTHPELMTPTFSGFNSEEPTPRGLGMHRPSLPTALVCRPSPFSSTVTTTNCGAQPRTDAVGDRSSVFDRFPWQAHFSLGKRDCTSLKSIGSDLAEGQQHKPQAQLPFQTASDSSTVPLNSDLNLHDQPRLLSDERPASAIAWATSRSLSAHIPYTVTSGSYGGNGSRMVSDFAPEGELKLNDILNIAVASRDPELLECSAKILRASLKYKDRQPQLRSGQPLPDSFMW